MAGTSNKTRPVTARVPVDLVEWMETEDGTLAEVVVRGLRALKDSAPVAGGSEHEQWLERRVAELEAEAADLRRKLMDALKAVLDLKHGRPTAGVPVPRVDAVSTKVISQHPAGPVLEPKLKVGGTAQPFFRPGTTAGKASKSGG